MEFAIQTIGVSYEDYLAAAKWAENKGMAAFAIPDMHDAGMSRFYFRVSLIQQTLS